MKKFYITYEKEDGKGNKRAYTDEIEQYESVTLWLKKHQAENCLYCFLSPTRKEAVEMAESWSKNYKINEVK